ncbi:MAG TPA: hypothetical protein VFZ65_06385 [Planctomycetota bacterium]|nr:hypothetical protein [Planctomycetota bacterium]
MIDLVCLVADKNMEAVVDGVLARPEALGIRAITFRILRHPQHDSACFHDPTPLLRTTRGEASHAIVLLDRAWEGAPDKPTDQLEADLEHELHQLGAGWARGIIIDPELEVWLFRRSPRLDAALGWHGRQPPLAERLASDSRWPMDAAKPSDPKATIEWALEQVRKPRSSSIYRDIASKLGLKACTDPSFLRFQATLRAWFPRP